MLIDILNSSNYILVNREAIQVLGLNSAVYCSELLNIYKKAVTKKKLTENNYFKLDRNYIVKQTSISVEDQLKCDANLVKVNIIKKDSEDPDLILFDVETYASILSSEDVKLLNSVSKQVKVKNPKGTKQAQRERIIINLKESINCKTPELIYALRDWIDAIMANPNKFLSVQQVSMFKDKIDDYCNGDLPLALKLVETAIIHQYVDCQWAINAYEKDKYVQSLNNKNKINVRTTEQKKTTVSNLGSEVF